VPDTNIFLHQPKPFDEVDWHATAQLDGFVTAVRIVIPIVIIDEIDRIKDVGNQPGTKARARDMLKKLVSIFGNQPPDKSQQLVNPDGAIGCQIEILPDLAGSYVRRRRPDDEIIRRVEHIRSYTDIPVTIVTSDTGMLFRAHQAEMRTICLERPPDQPKPPKQSKGGRQQQPPTLVPRTLTAERAADQKISVS